MAQPEQPSRPGSSSFYWAMRVMPRERRDAMFAVYRYCRSLDDIADGPGSAAAKLEMLQRWRAEIGILFAGGAPTMPEVAALGDPLRRFGLEREPLDAIILGMEMDARGEMLAPSVDDLQVYCYRVAGAVGLLAVRIFGALDPASRDFALALGDALQMTNILRDVEEDAARGRLYLPREFLERAGVQDRDPAAALRDPALPRACDMLAALADERYREALAALPPDPRPLRPAIIMMAVYARLLGRLRVTGWRPSAAPVRVPGVERFWIALRHLGPPATWPNSI